MRAVIRKNIAVFLLLLAVLGTCGICAQAQEETDGKQEIYNLLLIGTDKRDDSWNGNSDVMILVTLNPETEEIMLTSFMRDLYADIPGYGVHKLNYAFAVGGAEKLVETLEDNYRISIDNYAIVDFEDMEDIVDLAGGVEITASDAECTVLNQYLESMGAPEEDYIYTGGTYLLNGNQAVAYMRIRYVGNSDYQRTQRQRDVLKELFASVRDMNAAELLTFSTEAALHVEHDIGLTEMAELAAMLPKYLTYDLSEQRVPYDDLYHSQDEMLVPDFEATISRLHEALGIE
ncbi:cell envelope-like function transcriptional attenuator common domain protein [Marvinbryantia formatexigens DSM 14469]|uniref:Cell envelope-like function transcriptional attenuator common domain protein n=1 Tax=Marvinbryantia formatexigens DSM 14469 TaxID=478749 RepID=C6LMI5_9FIRM|nr:LCP family protein [Marvinbryantia formatexigens]EET58158.1 cell envelope-like function transcriptional attenuator common domain protein [Marvinbryantia formatexigens DSM 14469]UWO25471.1 LCP family protein [Marvinbryantia formatexigens DSM 14469]SDG90997.1 transcriptional attenuator, LytR family [Marvinbryantia formatexigens]